jgi:hypothetical protein
LGDGEEYSIGKKLEEKFGGGISEGTMERDGERGRFGPIMGGGWIGQ